jgi:hypothetical protein
MKNAAAISPSVREPATYRTRPLGAQGEEIESGPFVDGEQALLVLASYLVLFVLVAGWFLRRRDVA